MRWLKAIHDFQITVSGGYAIFTLLCVFYVVLMGAINLWQWIINLWI